MIHSYGYAMGIGEATQQCSIGPCDLARNFDCTCVRDVLDVAIEWRLGEKIVH